MTKIPERHSGFTTVELSMVVGMILILSSLGAFGLQAFLRAYRAGADARAIASQLSLARMRASSAFTRAQLLVDSAARTYEIRLDNDRNGTFESTEGGTHSFSPGVNLGSGSISTPPPEQTTISQSVDNASIQFNSRGIPVDGGGTPIGNNAIYLTNSDNDLFYAVTVAESGRVNVWQYVGSSWMLQ